MNNTFSHLRTFTFGVLFATVTLNTYHAYHSSVHVGKDTKVFIEGAQVFQENSTLSMGGENVIDFKGHPKFVVHCIEGGQELGPEVEQ